MPSGVHRFRVDTHISPTPPTPNITAVSTAYTTTTLYTHNSGVHRLQLHTCGTSTIVYSSCVCSYRCSGQAAIFVREAAAAMPSYFTFTECPLKESCSRSSFKAASVWGWNEQEARDRCVAHLMNSPYHNCSKDDAETYVCGGEFQEFDYEPPAAKKSKNQPHPPIEPPHELVARTAEQVMTMMQSGSSIGADVSCRRSDFQAIVDSVCRASTAVSAAERLALSAARAFADELAALEDVKAGLQLIADANDVNIV